MTSKKKPPANRAAGRATGGAKYPGTCATCEKPYSKGDPLRNTDKGWGHQACAPARSAMGTHAARVRSGETYRSQKPSTWRLGVSPGSRS